MHFKHIKLRLRGRKLQLEMVCDKQACELPPQFTINSLSYEESKLGAAQCSSPLLPQGSASAQLQQLPTAESGSHPIQDRLHCVSVTLEWIINLNCGSVNPAQKEREWGNLFLLGGGKLLGEGQCSSWKQPAASGCWQVLVSWWTLVLLTHSLLFAVSFGYLFCIQHHIWTSREHVGICI